MIGHQGSSSSIGHQVTYPIKPSNAQRYCENLTTIFNDVIQSIKAIHQN